MKKSSQTMTEWWRGRIEHSCPNTLAYTCLCIYYMHIKCMSVIKMLDLCVHFFFATIAECAVASVARSAPFMY